MEASVRRRLRDQVDSTPRHRRSSPSSAGTPVRVASPTSPASSGIGSLASPVSPMSPQLATVKRPAPSVPLTGRTQQLATTAHGARSRDGVTFSRPSLATAVYPNDTFMEAIDEEDLEPSFLGRVSEGFKTLKRGRRDSVDLHEGMEMEERLKAAGEHSVFF